MEARRNLTDAKLYKNGFIASDSRNAKYDKLCVRCIERNDFRLSTPTIRQ